VAFDDGWGPPEDEGGDEPARVPMVLSVDATRTIIARNDSPDIGFDRSINPYRGCEHGCIYCYARPSHAYLGLSPGLDFETRIFAKENAAELLRAELSRPDYRCELIALGANTDPYQPVERKQRITRDILEVLWEFRNPVGIVMKGEGQFAELLAKRFALACQRLGLNAGGRSRLDVTRFRAPRPAQGNLF